jgi:hypothetical protein
MQKFLQQDLQERVDYQSSIAGLNALIAGGNG